MFEEETTSAPELEVTETPEVVEEVVADEETPAA